MDATSLPPEVVEWALRNVPDGAFWLAVLGVGWRWWHSIAEHACEFIKDGLRITEKFADNGIDVRLKITHLGASIIGEPPSNMNREDPDGR